MIDTHCHLNLEPLSTDPLLAVRSAQGAGVSDIIVPGVSVTSSQFSVEVSCLPGVHAAVGLHPDAANNDGQGVVAIEKMLREHPEIVAVGEVGLDYLRPETNPEPKIQRNVFDRMLRLAATYHKPVIIHSREAFADTVATIQCLHAEGIGVPKCVVHCFTGTLEEAEVLLGLGCHLSLTGILTFKKNEALRQTVQKLPLERLMLETDAPFLTPEGFRGESNEPKHVLEVAKTLAKIKGMTVDAIDIITTATARQFFSI
jgi:TatD DNase family protein